MRGRGIGTRLISATEDLARARFQNDRHRRAGWERTRSQSVQSARLSRPCRQVEKEIVVTLEPSHVRPRLRPSSASVQLASIGA
jgi:GNAT superfamily N-acetyltransferase